MAGTMTRKERQQMPQLVFDCMQYRFSEAEALIYINTHLGRDSTGRETDPKRRSIKASAYYYYKRAYGKGEPTQKWLHEFTKVGYLISHHRLMASAEEEFHDIVKRLFIEKNKTILDRETGNRKENRDEYKIMKLREDLRQQGLYIMKLCDTTPIVAQVKRILQENNLNGKPATQSGESNRKPESDIPSIE